MQNTSKTEGASDNRSLPYGMLQHLQYLQILGAYTM